MVLLRCDSCGSLDFKDVGGVKVCECCGASYTPEAIKHQLNSFVTSYNITYNIQTMNVQNVYPTKQE